MEISWGQDILGRKNSQCKGLKVGTSLTTPVAASSLRALLFQARAHQHL